MGSQGLECMESSDGRTKYDQRIQRRGQMAEYHPLKV